MNPIATATRSSGPVRPATGNDCLDALSADAFGLLRPHLSEVAVDEGHVFWDAEIYLTTLFPASGLVSITVRLASGEGIEVASVAKEGAAAQFTLEPLHTVTQASAFAGGTFFRIPSAQLLAAAQRNEEIARLAHFCRDWVFAQAQQLAACNAVHSAEQRLCRWLAQSCRRLGTPTLHATQDGIAAALGIRRTTVTLLAQTLQTKGLIQYRRGKMVVTELARLESMSCECCRALDGKYWPSSRLQDVKKRERERERESV